MRILPVAALAAAMLAASLHASAQYASAPHKKIFGYQDVQTGTFHPLAQAEPDTVANTTNTGKYTVNFKVTIVTPLPAGSTIVCNASIVFSSVNEIITPPPVSLTTINYEETGSGSVAAGATGSTVTCPVVINYSWSFPPAMSSATEIIKNTVNASYGVIAIKASTATAVSLEESRSSGSRLPISSAPLATGGSATVTVPVTL